MAEHESTTTVGPLPDTTADSPLVPVALTWLTWTLFAASVVVLVAHDDVRGLLDDEWLSLTVVGQTQEHRAFHYAGELS